MIRIEFCLFSEFYRSQKFNALKLSLWDLIYKLTHSQAQNRSQSSNFSRKYFNFDNGEQKRILFKLEILGGTFLRPLSGHTRDFVVALNEECRCPF